MSKDHETELKPVVLRLGTLADFGIGNPNGIPSPLAEASIEEQTAYGEKLVNAIERVTDTRHLACIDGRKCECNADGSQPEVRRRQVGGTGLEIEVALNSEASILDTLDTERPLKKVINVVEQDIESKLGVKPSAHEGVCGGVNGAISDNVSINTNPAILETVEQIMGLPQVKEFTGVDYNPDIAERVRVESGVTAQYLEANEWDGNAYVAGVKRQESTGVEQLVVDAKDHEFHGHKEAALILVISKSGNYTISDSGLNKNDLGEAFVVNLDASMDMANAFGGQRGTEGVTQALIANLAKHVAVANRLPGQATPIYLVVTE